MKAIGTAQVGDQERGAGQKCRGAARRSSAEPKFCASELVTYAPAAIPPSQKYVGTSQVHTGRRTTG